MTSIWAGSTVIASSANADNTYKAQRFVATAAQTVFNLSAFAYQVGSGSLIVEINGVAQFIGLDFTETTNTSVTLVTPAEAGDVVVIRGFIGGTGAVAAAVSAEAAAISAAEAAASASTASTTLSATSTSSAAIGLGAKVFTVQAGKQFVAGQYLVIASTVAPTVNYMICQVTSYVGTTLNVNCVLFRGSGTIASWLVSISGINGTDGAIVSVVSTAASYTLTATPTALVVTPTTYGITVTLPDATSIAPIDPLHTITNAGAYPIRVVDSTGMLLGFIPASSKSTVGLVTSGAAGVRSVSDITLVGCSAMIANGNLSNGARCVIDIGSNRELIIMGSGYGVIFNRSTGVFGTITLIRTSVVNFRAVLVSTDKVLVVSCAAGATAFEAVVLTVTGNNFAVGTAATATLAATLTGSSLTVDSPFLTVGTSFVIGYSVTGVFHEARAMTVSGTTVTIGAAVRQSSTDGSGSGPALGYPGTGSVIVAATSSSITAGGTGYIYVTPYTVSGSTLTAGTLAQFTTGALAASVMYKFIQLSANRWYMNFGMNNGSTLYDAIVNLTGTTATINAAVRSSGAIEDAIVVSSTKILTMSSSTSNNGTMITDNAGVVVISTALTIGPDAGSTKSFVSSVNNVVQAYTVFGGSSVASYIVNCSTATPTLTQLGFNFGAPANLTTAYNRGCNLYGRKDPWRVSGVSISHAVVVDAVNKTLYGSNRTTPMYYPAPTFTGMETAGAAWFGRNESEVWLTNTSSIVILKMECVSW